MFQGYQRYDLLERSYKRHLDQGILTVSDVRIIKQYVNERKATKQLSDPRTIKIAYTLILWRKFLDHPYDSLTLIDVYSGINKIPHAPIGKHGGKPTQNTVHDYIAILKPFLRWMSKHNIGEINSDDLNEIKTPAINPNTTESDEILTPEEVVSLVQNASNIRDRAILSLLYESACRVGEIADLRWRDLVFDKYGISLTIVDTKTKKKRYGRLVLSTDYISAWKSNYPGGNPSGPNHVFVSSSGQPLEHPSFIKLIYRARKRAGIEKRVHPHLFRKSRITHMVSEGYQESVIKETAWGNINTKMFDTYVVLSKENIDHEFLRMAGVEIDSDEIQEPIKPRTCGNCHHVSAPTFDYCPKCGFPLTDEAKSIDNEIEKTAREHGTYIETIADLEIRMRSLESELKKRDGA